MQYVQVGAEKLGAGGSFYDRKSIPLTERRLLLYDAFGTTTLLLVRLTMPVMLKSIDYHLDIHKVSSMQ
jgi:hypothetical protein